MEDKGEVKYSCWNKMHKLFKINKKYFVATKNHVLQFKMASDKLQLLKIGLSVQSKKDFMKDGKGLQ